MSQIKLIEKDDHFVVRLTGNFTGGVESAELKQTLSDIAVNPKNKVYIDLQEVEYITSTIIGTFLSINSKFRETKGKMVFFSPNAYISELFDLTKLSEVIPTCYSLTDLEEILRN